MTTVYAKSGTTFIEYFNYRTASGGVTGKTAGDFTIEAADDGTGNQSTTGITIAEVDASNNAGLYSITFNGSTSVIANNGAYTFTVYDTASPQYAWELTVIATDETPTSSDPSSATFTATASDGRVTDGTDPLAGATILITSSSAEIVYQLTSDVDGLWGPVALADDTYAVTALADGYQQASGTITVTAGTATGPGSDLELDAITTSSSITAGELWEYARRQSHDVIDASRANTVLKEIVNDAMFAVATMHEWEWFMTAAVITTNAAYTTGTLSATNGSTTVTLSGGTFPSWAADGEVWLDGTFYTVATRDSDTQLTLDDAYQGDTASGLDYTLYQDSYSLPSDMLKMGTFLNDNYLGEARPSTFIEVQTAKASYSPATGGYASLYAFKNNRIIIWPPPADAQNNPYVYYRRPAKLTSSEQTIDFNPSLESLIHRAIDYSICMKYGRTSAGLDAVSAKEAMEDELERSLDSNKTLMTSRRPLSRGTIGDSVASRWHRARRF